MTNKRFGAMGLALLLAACAGEDPDSGSAMVLVRSDAAYAENGSATLRVFAGADATWDSPNPVFVRELGAAENGEWRAEFDFLAVGGYTFCAQATAGVLAFGPNCVNATVTKSRMAVVSLVLQQDGTPPDPTIDSPLISGISVSDGAPAYGQPVDIDVTVQNTTTDPAALTYAWSATCEAGLATFTFDPADAASTTLTTDCKGIARITITVSDGEIVSSVTFPIRYYPQGADVTVTLNRWPVFSAFAVAQAQLEPGASTTVSVTMADDEALSFAWSSTCGSLVPSTTAVTTFTAPDTVTDCTITVEATDGIGGSARASVLLHVRDAVAPTLVVFDNLPEVLPYNLPSLGFQATQTSEFGDLVALAEGVGRRGDEATFLLSTWATEAYTHPITLTLYAVEDGAPGAPLLTVTQTFAIPARPAADPTCATPTAWRAPDDLCYNGYLFPITFDLGGVVLPDSFIYGIAYNTQTWGYDPIGVSGPWTSLNVAVVADAPTIGTDVDPDAVFWNTATAGWYADGGPGGTFRKDTEWAGTVPAARFTAY